MLGVSPKIMPDAAAPTLSGPSDASAPPSAPALSGPFEAAAKKMAPVVRDLLVDNADPSTVPIDVLLTALGRHTHGARKAACEGDVMQIESLLSPEACAKLRHAVDQTRSTEADSVDQGPEHQLNLSRERLTSLLGEKECRKIWELPLAYRRWRRMQPSMQPSGSNNDMDEQGIAAEEEPPPPPEPITDEEAAEEALSLKECFIRRYAADERPFITFHPDAYQVTVNIALSADADHGGGRLLGLFNGKVQALVRPEGGATIHSSQLLHAVSRMTDGIRYSLIAFFDRAPRNGSHPYRWTEQRWGGGQNNARWWE